MLLPKIQRNSMFPAKWSRLPCMNIEVKTVTHHGAEAVARCSQVRERPPAASSRVEQLDLRDCGSARPGALAAEHHDAAVRQPRRGDPSARRAQVGQPLPCTPPRVIAFRNGEVPLVAAGQDIEARTGRDPGRVVARRSGEARAGAPASTLEIIDLERAE